MLKCQLRLDGDDVEIEPIYGVALTDAVGACPKQIRLRTLKRYSTEHGASTASSDIAVGNLGVRRPPSTTRASLP